MESQEKINTYRKGETEQFLSILQLLFYWLIPDLIFQAWKLVASSSSTPSQLEMSRRWPGRCVTASTHQQQTVVYSCPSKPSSSCLCTNHAWWVAYCFARVHAVFQRRSSWFAWIRRASGKLLVDLGGCLPAETRSCIKGN